MRLERKEVSYSCFADPIALSTPPLPPRYNLLLHKRRE